MNKLKFYWEVYYPVILAFLSFLYSVSLWLTGNKLEGIFYEYTGNYSRGVECSAQLDNEMYNESI